MDEDEKEVENLHVFTSLGIRRYLSLMKFAEFVLGNSSSGIIETPVFRVPIVNIEDRQRERLQSDSVINCGSSKTEIVTAIRVALSDEHKEKCKTVILPYGNGYAAERIVKKTTEVVLNGGIDLKKVL